MQIHDVEQNTEAWAKARLGIPTCSAFSKILTPDGKPSDQATTYMHTLIAEKIASVPLESWGGNMWSERGHELEEEARSYYEMVKGVDVDQVGFASNELAGGSPDGLISKDGGMEIKCPSPGIHISYLLGNKVPTIYIPQIQGSMWIFDRDWWDFITYHPILEKLIVRVHRDGKYIATLEAAIKKFREKMHEKEIKLEKLGYKI